MAELLLIHHVHGLTDGVVAFADRLRAGGHTVHTPDLFDGRTFDSIEAGMAHEEETLGWEEMKARAAAAAEGLPNSLVYGGFSMGVVYSHVLVHQRPGARGGLFLESATNPDHFGGWPAGVPVQVHGHADDPFFGAEGIANAEALVAAAGDGEVFVYPGDSHLFTDSSLPQYDETQTALVVERALAFLDRV